MPERAVDESSTELEQGFCLFHFFQLPPTYIIAEHKRDQGEEFRIACLGCLNEQRIFFDSLFGLFFKKKKISKTEVWTVQGDERTRYELLIVRMFYTMS